jgi:hypothetical protein
MRSDPTQALCKLIWAFAGMPAVCECESPGQRTTKIGREVPSQQRVFILGRSR